MLLPLLLDRHEGFQSHFFRLPVTSSLWQCRRPATDIMLHTPVSAFVLGTSFTELVLRLLQTYLGRVL